MGQCTRKNICRECGYVDVFTTQYWGEYPDNTTSHIDGKDCKVCKHIAKGVGRPKGTTIPPDQKKRNFTTKLGPEWFTFLDEMKAKGHSKAWCINKGLELLREHLSG